jgi:hypothetical protein
VVRHSSVLGDPAKSSSAATVVVLVLTLSSFSRTFFHIDSEASPLSVVAMVAMVAMVVEFLFVVSSFFCHVVSKASSGAKFMFRSRM